MADISAQPIPDLGQMLNSYGQGQANIGLTNAQAGASQASAGLMGAQTGLVGQQTQKAAFEVQMIKKAMASLDNLSNSQDEKSGEQSQISPTEAGIASSLNSKFGFVDPVGPPGMQQYINATAFINPQEAQRAEEWRKMLVARKQAQNTSEANDIFQTASTLSNSGGGLDSLLKTTAPGSYLNNVGKAIASDDTKSPEEKDASAREAINAAAKYSHQYTGRKTDYVGDQAVDSETKFPVSGVPTAGLTAEQKVDFGKWTKTPMTVTIDNRPTTITPAALGIKSPQDLVNNKSLKFSVPPPTQASPSSPNAPGSTPQPPGGGPQGPMSPQQARNTPVAQGGAPVPGLNADQSDFVKSQPQGIQPVNSNSSLNADDLKSRDIYREQAKKLADTTNTESARAHDTLNDINRINALMKTPGLTFGPGSHEYSQVRTILENWTGTPAGQASAFQVLSKVLNASEMNGLLQEFHNEGAQVRLGAYESRLIMDKLAANPNLTKDAIQQMLTWQASDAHYALDKAKVASAVLNSGKSVATFSDDYGNKFPKEDSVDSSLSVLNKLNPKGVPDFSKIKQGATYTDSQVSEAAAAAGIPKILFSEKLKRAGAVIQ